MSATMISAVGSVVPALTCGLARLWTRQPAWSRAGPGPSITRVIVGGVPGVIVPIIWVGIGPCHGLGGGRHALALRGHALDIAHVVALLQGGPGSLGGAR